MSLYNSGNMYSYSVPIIKGDMWIVKSALNNTNIWTDVSQNNLSCTVTTDVQSNMVEINSTKSDANGTITEIYHYDQYKGIKHTIYFTNNDPSLTNHKFSFSNILEETPKSFTTVIVVNQTDPTDGDLSFESYSLWDSANQPIEFGGNGTILDWQSSEVISYNATQFLLNGTQVYDGFNLLYKQAVPTINPYHYSFGDGFGQLSDVKFQSQTDNTLDVYIHYANVTQILPVGDTTSIDPTLEQLSITNVVRSGNLRFRDCSISAQISQDTVFETFFRHTSTGNVFDQCFYPTMVFDITNIPDIATPINGTLILNLTSVATANLSFLANWYNIVSDQITGLTNADLHTAVFSSANIFDNIPDFDMGNYGSATCDTTSCKESKTLITDNFIIDFEAQLETGRNFYQLFNCPEFGQSQTKCDSDRAGFFAHTQRVIFDQATSFLEVTYEIFTVASAPQSLIATFSPSPDKCLADWELPLDNGGRIITGWKIERSTNNGSFTTLVADTGTQIPTSFTDSTITTDESYIYRVSAINQEGIGAIADSLSCGIPAIADPPTLSALGENPISKIELNWTPPNFDGGLPIDGYKIERSSGGGAFSVLIANTGNTNTLFTDGTVQGNVLFSYRVSTINSLGTSTPSNEQSFTIVIATGAGAVGSPIGAPSVDEDLLTQQEFDKALAEAIAQIPPLEITVFETVIETVIQTFFEFAIVDVTHDELTLNSFLQNERLGIRWSSGQNIVIVSTTPALSPFSFTFEQFPVIKRGSGAVISTDFILYDLQVPRNECTRELTRNCVEKIRYEIPITVNAVLNGTNVSDRGTITINLVEDEIDPILLIILSTLAIPVVAGLVQRRRGRGTIQPLRRVV